MPSTGITSPGNTRITSPTVTTSAGNTSSLPLRTIRAVVGVNLTRRSMPACALDTVNSSSIAPSCMMKAISAAANTSPIATAAISAKDTKRSAFTSNSSYIATAAPHTIGKPHNKMVNHAQSNGNPRRIPNKLNTTPIPPATNVIFSRFKSNHSATLLHRSIRTSCESLYNDMYTLILGYIHASMYITP